MSKLLRPYIVCCALVLSLAWVPACTRPARAQAQGPVTTLLITHPRASVLHFYDTLVRQKILQIPNLRLVGIYHSSETEDYRDAITYIEKEHIEWMSVRSVQCPVNAETMYADSTCRDEFKDLVTHSAGIIFNGGPDIPPVLYGRPTLLTTVIETPHRHIFELSLLFHMLGGKQNPAIRPLLAERPDYAVLGICVGMQSMNVADGGTLLQDIPSEVYGRHTLEDVKQSDPNTLHRNFHKGLDPEPDITPGVFHPIKLTLSAPAALRHVVPVPFTPQVLSIHHQAVGDLGRDYTVTATSLDGKIIEGIHHKRFGHVWGWQFHPERSFLWDRSEVQRMMEGDPETNIGYATLHRDRQALLFNQEIWKLFAKEVAGSQKHGRKSP